MKNCFLIIFIIFVAGMTCFGRVCNKNRIEAYSDDIFKTSEPLDAAGRTIKQIENTLMPIVDSNQASSIQFKKTIKGLGNYRNYNASFKPSLLTGTFDQPWEGMKLLEEKALRLSRAVKGKHDNRNLLKDLLALVLAMRDWEISVGSFSGNPTAADNPVTDISVRIRGASEVVNKCFMQLSKQEKKFMFDFAAEFAKDFKAHIMGTDPATMKRYNVNLDKPWVFNAENQAHSRKELKFFQLWNNKCVPENLGQAMVDLIGLADADQPEKITEHLKKVRFRLGKQPEFVKKGKLEYWANSERGWIIIAGNEDNVYEINEPVALLMDLGGDDIYRGSVAANIEVGNNVSVIIDFNGDDIYEPDKFALATGRLGVAALIDNEGNDTYKLPEGTGGCGFAGLGLLMDQAGDDEYIGSRFSIAAAICGNGILIDKQGNDSYTSYRYSIGVGAPGGAGVLLDSDGNDFYKCGFKDPSGYNQAEWKPQDPRYQYSGHGIGLGTGKRIYSPDEKQRAFNLGGGVGGIIDIRGNDKYQSSNFSQGCGYFYGIGLKIDIEGNDEHNGARYGMGCGAHYAMGLFADYQGDDKYNSAGPTYNCGCAWDYCVFAFIDGEGNDVYDLSKSAGLARADHTSLSIFAEMAGKDKYITGAAPAETTDNSFTAFLDMEGNDDYEGIKSSKNFKRTNNTQKHNNGGVFVDF